MVDQSPSPTSLPFCGDFDIRIKADGTWYYQGTPIGRKPLVKLFSSVLRREEDDGYWLVTPVERGRIVVDDAPFVAEEVVTEGSGRDQTVRLRTNLDEWVELDGEHPLRVAGDGADAEPRPYILVRGRLEARILRNVYYHLVELSETAPVAGQERVGLWSKGRFFPLDPDGAV